MSPIATHPMTRLSTGTIDPDGVDLVIASAGVDLPETGYGSYEVALHEDGAHCTSECRCVDAEDRTTIWEGTTVTYGEWTWHASRYALIGWHSVGPTKPEILKRAEVLAEDLDAERGNHRVTTADLNHNIRVVTKLGAELDELTEALGQVKEARERAETQRDHAERWVLRLTVAAVILAAALVWAVIA